MSYLTREHAPVTEERHVVDLPVKGALPEALDGLYVRNSPSPQFAPLGRYHWFDGDGMVHGLRLEGGRASYFNRWIRTAGFEQERRAGRALWSGILEPLAPGALELPGGPLKDTANTDVVVHEGRLYALWWLCGTPYELSPSDLSTVGPQTFGGGLTRSMCAHAKVDPRSGELVFFDFSLARRPAMRTGVVDREGRVVHTLDVELPVPHILHDLAITERYTVLMDFPLGWDRARLAQGKRRIAFDRETPSRFGIVPRRGTEVRWFEAEPGYMYHSVNAFEAGDEVVVRGCRVADPIPETPSEAMEVPRLDIIELVPHLYEWRFNLATGAVAERQLDDLPTEFPRANDTRAGMELQYGYHPTVAPRPELSFDGLVKYRLASGQIAARWEAPPGWFIGEAAFAPRPGGSDEDDGWLVTFGTSVTHDASAAFVLSARELSLEATVMLPARIPLGFHSAWRPG